jgi:hypothetical protein
MAKMDMAVMKNIDETMRITRDTDPTTVANNTPKLPAT